MCDVAILAVPDLNEAGFLEGLRTPLAGKIVISPIVPMRMENGLLVYSKTSDSAAVEVASILKESRVVAALHHIPALTILKKNKKIDFDVLVACNSRGDYEVTSNLIRSVEGFRPLYVGPLSMARIVESITPLLINSAKLNRLNRLSLKLVV